MDVKYIYIILFIFTVSNIFGRLLLPNDVWMRRLAEAARSHYRLLKIYIYIQEIEYEGNCILEYGRRRLCEARRGRCFYYVIEWEMSPETWIKTNFP